MVEKPKKFIHIDLNQFKLHIGLLHTSALTLQFDSPSRRFYLSVIAFVVHEMKRLGKITSIPLDEHLELLGLLNETVGGSAGSSQSAHLLPRIYRKWKDALPDLEDAPLFKVLGRKRKYEEGLDAAYQFTEEEKDTWANLFEYRGSEEHVRLRFSIDKLGTVLDDVVITYGEDPELIDDAAWDRFIADLRQEAEKQQEHAYNFSKEKESGISPLTKWKRVLPLSWKWPALAAVIAIVAAFAIWQYSWYAPHKEGTPSEKMAFPLPLPDKPSIAVLPFTNMSGDPEQEYFSDGLTEEIITALSKVPYLFVIARNSTFFYKTKPVKIRQVAENLGVRYVLEGSFRKAGDRVRVTAQLIDAITGHHLWAECYERELKDIFALQDEITMKIITALQVKLTEAEQARLLAKGTDNLEAYLKLLQGREHVYRFNKENNALARDMFQEAIALDPVYPKPYAFLGTTHLMDIWLGSSKSPRQSLAKAIELAQKAIALDDSYATAHGLLGNLYIMTRQYDKGIAECERGVALDPNSASALGWLGQNLYWADKPEEAISVLEKAIRLNPIPPSWYLYNLAMAYRDTGRYEEAISACKKVLHREPKNVIALLVLTGTYSLSGREEEARAGAAEILRIDPMFSLERLAKTRPHKNQANTERFIDSLRKAGLK